MTAQLAFTQVLAEAEERRLDAHRSAVQNWFDALNIEQKTALANLLAHTQWETCSSLCAAAGSWHEQREKAHAISNAA